MNQGLRRWLLVAGGLVVILVAALIFVTQSFAEPGQDLAGSEWQLIEVNGRAPIEALDPADIAFDRGGKVGGNTGCNSFGGVYAVEGSQLTLSELASTLRACADPAQNDQEAEVLAALNAVAQYDIDGDTLTLQDADGAARLAYTRA